mgnify:CR=1 FL=1
MNKFIFPEPSGRKTPFSFLQNFFEISVFKSNSISLNPFIPLKFNIESFFRIILFFYLMEHNKHMCTLDYKVQSKMYALFYGEFSFQKKENTMKRI